jgi:large exoprotein involved in heme utilization and adhesion
MNPAGFLVGPGATVNVSGMVSFTTADYLKLSDGTTNGYFYADPAGPSLLTAAPVAAFGFLGSNAASIAIQGGTLEVPDGKTLSFIGGPRVFTPDTGVTVPSGVTMTAGRLSAPNGLIYMETVTAPGEIPLPTLSGNPLGIPVSFPGSENAVIRIQSGEFVMKGASLLTATTGPTIGEPIGIDVEIAGQFTMQNLSTLFSSTTEGGQGGAINVSASTLAIDASSIVSATSGQGTGGNVSVLVAGLDLSNGAQIVSNTTGTGKGGSIGITATDRLSIAGFDTTGTAGIVDPDSGFVRSGVYSSTSSSGKGGDITLSTQMLTMEEGALLSSLTSGDGQGGGISVIDTGAVSLASGAQITSRTDGTGHGGEIVIAATDSILMGGLSFDTFSLSGIVSQTTASGSGGNIAVSAPDVTLQDMGQIRSFTSSSLADNAGTGGTIEISAPGTLSISGFVDDFGIGSGIFSTGEYGNSGSVIISGGTVNVSDRGIVLTSQNLNGSAGNITFDVTSFSLTGGAEILTVSGSSGTPSTGTIKIMASDTVLISGQFDTSTPSRISNESNSILGSNGGIEIQASQFLMSLGGNILSNTDAPQGGTIHVSATDSITMASGAEMINRRGSLEFGSLNLGASSITLDQSVIRSRTFGDHDAGKITLSATGGNLVLSNDSHILTSTQQGSGTAGAIVVSASDSVLMSSGSTIESSSENIASGNGGLVTVTAQNLVSLTGTGTGLFTLTDTTGNGGAINVQANQAQLSAGAVISAKSSGLGAAGNIDITATNGLTMQNSSITTEAGQGAGGGNIKVTTDPSATVLLENSQISASVADGPGGGGNIWIDPQYVILQNSQILAQAAQGQGGAITITANLFLQDATSIVNADSGSGVNGTVTIQSPNAPASGKIQPLGKTPLQATSLLNQHCASLAGGEFSSFTVAGRDSLPTEPGSWLVSPLVFATLSADAGRVGKAEGVKAEGGRPVMGGETAWLSLRQIAPAGFLTQAFAVDGPKGCQS